jgi:hypothetical protein
VYADWPFVGRGQELAKLDCILTDRRCTGVVLAYPDQLDEYGAPRDRCVVAALSPQVLKLSAERSASVRELFRLVQLEQVAERIVQEGLVPGARDERDPEHLDAVLLQVGDGGIDVVDSDREVVRTGRLEVGLHQVHLLAAGVKPVPRAEIGARQLRHAKHVAIEGETLLRVGDADGDMVYTGWLHRSHRIRHSCMTFRIGTSRLVVRVGLTPCTGTATLRSQIPTTNPLPDPAAVTNSTG